MSSKWKKFNSGRYSNSVEETNSSRYLIPVLFIVGLAALAIFKGSSLLNFFHLESLIVVCGGLVLVGIVSYSSTELVFTMKRIFQVLNSTPENPKHRIYLFGNLAHLVRAEGLMALENECRRIKDSFLRRALELAADSNSEKDLVRILETEKVAFADRERRSIEVLETLGHFSPGIGLIGTLLGLVDLMLMLDNPQAIGPAMSLALLTTLYGAVFSNLIFLPLAARLRVRSEEDTVLRLLTIEATVSLLKTENPTLLEQRLETFLPAFSESRKAA